MMHILAIVATILAGASAQACSGSRALDSKGASPSSSKTFKTKSSKGSTSSPNSQCGSLQVNVTCKDDDNEIDCNDIPPPVMQHKEDCKVTINFIYSIANVGQAADVCFNLTTVNRTLDGSTLDIVSGFADTFCPGNIKTFEERTTGVDICIGQKAITTLEVEAEIVSSAGESLGETCEASDEYCFETDMPPTQSPTSSPAPTFSGRKVSARRAEL